MVDKRALASNNNPGTWLPVELIYESVELGELQPLAKYYQTPEQKGKEIRRKLKYTVEEDVAMLDFLEVSNVIVRKKLASVCIISEGCAETERRPPASS